MRYNSVRRNRSKVRSRTLLERAEYIARLMRRLAIDNNQRHELDASKLYAAQDAINDVAFPGIPDIGNAPKGA